MGKGFNMLIRAASQPLVFTTSGGMGPKAKCFYSRLADIMAEKKHQPRSHVVAWMRCRLSFSLLRSALLCLRTMNESGEPEGVGRGSGGQSWVQFEEEEAGGENGKPPTTQSPPNTPAVIDAQAVQVSLDNHTSSPEKHRNSVSKTASEPANGVPRLQAPPTTAPGERRGEARVTLSPLSPAQLHNVPLHDAAAAPPPIHHPPPPSSQNVVRQGFSNGDVIVTLLPQNTSMPWVTPAQFRPELVPEELMAQGLTLTVEDYVHIMSQLVNDYRFTLYNVCYKRVLMIWIITGFLILLAILFSGLSQLALFGAGIGWLMVNAAAIFFCMWIKIKVLNKSLEQCLAEINVQLLRHKIILGLDDRGKLSCHKVNLCFIYFDTHDCVHKLQEVMEEEERAGRAVNSEEGAKLPSLRQRMDIDDSDIIITGATNTRISRQQERAKLLLTRYSQRWAKDFLRKRLDWAFDATARLEGLAPPVSPRHLPTARCPCQYIEEHLFVKLSRHHRHQQPSSSSHCGCLTRFCQDAEL
ncbi:Transmembrane protein 268 [Chionoecetes opilio]|uniref:Transmembrane protein 268 n=1 Tax=Chionoecetes opilio TaxID=41210 RepID=A0A8J4XZH3_CHIOP|nr:Transmembrane protein 268 [Chionoecetes opilio]